MDSVFRGALRNGIENYEVEFRLLHKNGHYVPVLSRGFITRDENGNPIRVTGTNMDLSERKQAEMALRESEEKYRILFENAPVGIGIADETGNVLVFNDAMLHPGGYNRQDFEKMANLKEFYNHWDVREKVLKKAFEQGFLIEEEVQFRRKDGTLYDALLSLRPIQIEGKLCWQAIVHDVTDRKKAENEIQKARREWENIFQAIGHPTLVLDADHRLIHANAAAEKSAGRPEKELMGKTCYQIFHNTNEPSEGCPFERMAASNPFETIEMEMEALGGDFLVSCTPMLDKEGRIEKVIHIATDITERKRADEMLKASEERYRALFDNMKDGVAIYEARNEGEDFVFIDLNTAAEKIENVPKDALIGKSALEVFPGVKEFGIFDVFKRVWKTGEPEKHPIGIYKDERIAGWRENFVCKLPSGEIVVIYTDETDRKLSEQALKESEEKLCAINDTALDAIFCKNKNRQYTFVNPAMIQLLGRTRDDLIGKIADEVFDKENAAIINDVDERTLNGEKISEIRTLIVAGRPRTFQTIQVPLRNADGNITGISGIVRDVTDFVQTEKALRESEKLYQDIFEKEQRHEMVGGSFFRKDYGCQSSRL